MCEGNISLCLLYLFRGTLHHNIQQKMGTSQSKSKTKRLSSRRKSFHVKHTFASQQTLLKTIFQKFAARMNAIGITYSSDLVKRGTKFLNAQVEGYIMCMPHHRCLFPTLLSPPAFVRRPGVSSRPTGSAEAAQQLAKPRRDAQILPGFGMGHQLARPYFRGNGSLKSQGTVPF